MARRYWILAFLGVIWICSLNARAVTPVPVVLKVAPGANLSVITKLLGGTVIDSIPEANTYLLTLPALPVLTSTLRLLGVDWVELDRGVSLPSIPALGLLDVPWETSPAWYGRQPALELIGSHAALGHSSGRGLVIADINSRVDYGHPALLGHLGAGYDFVEKRSTQAASLNDQAMVGFLDDQAMLGFLDDDQWTLSFLDNNGVSLTLPDIGNLSRGARDHGTFCAGILAVVAPDATIMSLRAFDDNGNSDLFTLAKAIRYARRNGAQVVNMSFGTLTDARILREAIDYANAGNVVLVASAGNANTASPQFPAAYSGVIAVASTDLLDRKTSFSNFGRWVFVDAPGNHVISALAGGGYGIANGTSFSAPMVAGLAALIRSTQNGDAKTIIARSAIPIDSRNPRYTGMLGYGRVDLLKAMQPR